MRLVLSFILLGTCFFFFGQVSPSTIIFQVLGAGGHDFCYEEDPKCGPESESWGGVCKTGKHQSPIDLPPIKFRRNVKLTFNEGYSSKDYWVRSNGHTVQASLQKEPTSGAKMAGYGLDRPYIFAQVHFHWGRDGKTGSEHTLDKKAFPMEVHLVHYDSQYPNLTAAALSGSPTALAVLGVFVEEGSNEDKNTAFDQLTSFLPLFYQEDSANLHFPLDLRSFLPSKGHRMYRYMGSLTTPTCNEAIVWTVLETPIRVQPASIERFRHVLNNHHELVGVNYRPVQPLGDRTVEYLEMT